MGVGSQDLKEGEYNLVLQFAKIENLKTKSNIAINLTIKKQK